MPKISKFFLLIISELLFLLIILIVLPSIFIREKPGVYQNSYHETLSLDSKNSFSQNFISDQDNLHSISVLLKNPALINQSQIKIEVQDQNQNTLRSLETSGVSVGDPNWINFKFPYINSKKGDIFFIKISTNNQQLDHLFVYGDSKSKSINFKTTFATPNFKESFKKNLIQQINNFKMRSVFHSIIYLFLIITINFLIFL